MLQNKRSPPAATENHLRAPAPLITDLEDNSASVSEVRAGSGTFSALWPFPPALCSKHKCGQLLHSRKHCCFPVNFLPLVPQSMPAPSSRLCPPASQKAGVLPLCAHNVLIVLWVWACLGVCPLYWTPSSALQLVDAQEAFIEIKGHMVSLKFTIVKFV